MKKNIRNEMIGSYLFRQPQQVYVSSFYKSTDLINVNLKKQFVRHPSPPYIREKIYAGFLNYQFW